MSESKQTPVWYQNLRGFIQGVFPSDKTWRGIFLKRLDHMANSHAEMLEALVQIAEATDPDNPDSYRCDDREGCLDTVQSIARAAIDSAEDRT